MNQRYIDYTLYNIWANKRIIENIKEHPDELMTQQADGSFPTLRDTILHLWMGEAGWLSRLTTNNWNTQKVDEFSGTNQELFDAWQKTSESFKEFTKQADLEKAIVFDQRGVEFSIPSREIIQTVCNHGSYHRGQLVVMMRQLGVERIVQTDYVEWVREKQRGNL